MKQFHGYGTNVGRGIYGIRSPLNPSGFPSFGRWDREQKSVMDGSYRESLEKFCTLIGWEWEIGLLRSCSLALLSDIRAWRRPCGRIFHPLDASKIFKLLTRKEYYPPKYIQPDWCPGPSTNKVVNSALELLWDRYEAPAKPPRIYGSSFNQWKWVVYRWVAIQL